MPQRPCSAGRVRFHHVPSTRFVLLFGFLFFFFFSSKGTRCYCSIFMDLILYDCFGFVIISDASASISNDDVGSVKHVFGYMSVTTNLLLRVGGHLS